MEIKEPGILDTDTESLEAILASTVANIIMAFDDLTPVQLEQMLILERAGKARTSALDAIQKELERVRDSEALDETIVIESSTNIGDSAKAYANKRAHEVDLDKITTPVLTLDGYVLPRPKAEGY